MSWFKKKRRKKAFDVLIKDVMEELYNLSDAEIIALTRVLCDCGVSAQTAVKGLRLLAECRTS